MWRHDAADSVTAGSEDDDAWMIEGARDMKQGRGFGSTDDSGVDSSSSEEEQASVRLHI